ncbi:acyltransferase-like protein [Anseongella ginsenosidimutans]|uniref:Acyltransferase-like protein n=1 Tax=Anseongella ginsenosidimutans TaxID=496056 RepID=A0A4R3KVQ4_9SPHI|nr:acyltransferase family protein [Anseongella ginsenosidimutans]QEC51874.1 acyltransferase [Anseongella ginsenosidimutans]TCS89258.1 acyltransferase-like protein [Anseongella ginsenosidimutans]
MEARRYDIDWIRVIAIGLLLLYHVAIGFQSWGMLIGFITTEQTWPSLWIPMSMLNVWRIPLLFFVSGMGACFALRQRTWAQLLPERAKRILLPFLFGMVAIVPIHVYLWQQYNDLETGYAPGPGHLWFLGNLFIYVLFLTPLFYYLKRGGGKALARKAEVFMRSPLGLLPMFALFILEVLILEPFPFERYAMTWHGFFLGLLAFFFGYFFVWCGAVFWNMLLRWRWLFLLAAATLFALRLSFFQSLAPNYLVSIESNCWVLAVFAFGYRHFNRPSCLLSYLSQAAYPVYIVHMVFLYLGSLLIFPLGMPVPLQFVLLLLFTFLSCFACYELLIRRVRFIRPLFGLKT